ncbi:WD40 repeat-like protein [Penicillium herquei]|nr:WD40 repeat-like protein [Penicillium herquei]
MIASPSVCLWDVNTGTLLKRFDPLGCPRYVAFSEDGEQIMALSMEGNVRTWDVSSGILLQEVSMCTEHCLAILSHDKTTMACYIGNTVQVIAIATKRVILSFEVHNRGRGDLEISQDNRLLACGFDDGSVQLWNNDTGRIQHELIFQNTSPVVHVAFSGDGRLLLSLAGDGNLQLWDTDTGKLQESFQCSILDAIFSLDSKLLIFIKKEFDESGPLKRVFFWDLESRLPAKVMPTNFVGLRLSPDERLVTSVPVVRERLDYLSFLPVLSNLIQVWDTASGKPVNTLGSHSEDVLDVIFSPKTSVMASYGEDKTVRIWDLSASPSQDKREKHDSAVIAMFLTANLEVISLSGPDHQVCKFWDVKARASLQQELFAHCDGPVKFTANYEFLIGSEGSTIEIVEGATGMCVCSIGHPDSFGYEYSFNPQTNLLGKSRCYHNFDDENEDDTKLRNDVPIVKIWDLVTRTVLHTLYGPSEQTIQLKFSPDGQLLALQRSLAGIIKEIEIWDVKSWQLHQKLEQDEERVKCDFTWSPDGAMIGILFDKICSDESTGVRQFNIWNLNSGRLVSLFEQTFYLDGELYPRMYKPMFSVFSGDRKLATTNASESTIQLWNIETCQMVGQRQFTSLEENYSSSEQDDPMSFSEDSQTLKTRHGRLDVRSFDPHWDGVGSRDLFVDDGWVFHGQKKIILLPHDYRPTCVLAVDNTLVMGHASGHVTFLELAPQDSST